jgi:predicted dinucleotide-binding enzyme
MVGYNRSGNAVSAVGAVPGEAAHGRATLQQAAEEDTVFLAVLWNELGDTLSGIADWEGRILIDATNPILPGSKIADLGGRTSSEIVRELSPGAQLVKAFNTLSPAALAVEGPGGGGSFFSGDALEPK